MAKALASVVLLLCCALPAPSIAAEATTRVTWSDLTTAQRRLLAPLESEWVHYNIEQRKRWIAVADRYPKMTPAEQKRVQERMQEWAKLTPQQREAARTRYRALSKLTPEQRRSIVRQWTESQEAQQALPAETAPPIEPADSSRSAESKGPADAGSSTETAAAPGAEKPPAAAP